MRKNYLVLLGNILEFYDFTLFAALLPIIATQLFPAENTINAYTYTYIFLAIGFWSRPAGAVIFGYLGDRFSRLSALTISILMMTVATIIVGLIPTNAGVYSIIILALCRMLQGFSSGGEYSGASLVLIEGQSTNRFFNGACLIASGLGGGCLASLSAALISTSYFPVNAWRYLFVLAGCLGLFAIWAQVTTLKKSNNFIKQEQHNTVAWKELFKNYKIGMYCTISFSSISAFLFVISHFLNTYLAATMSYTKTSLLLITAGINIFCAIMLVIFGYLAKRYNPHNMMRIGLIALLALIVPFFTIVYNGNLYNFVAIEILMVVFIAMFYAPCPAIEAALFPYEVRYRGVALGNCIGLAIAGSCSYISAKLIAWTNLNWSPVFYLLVLGICALSGVYLAKKKYREQLGQEENIAFYSNLRTATSN
jgi:MHS family proline/betaine transporter-like MFS transporter